MHPSTSHRGSHAQLSPRVDVDGKECSWWTRARVHEDDYLQGRHKSTGKNTLSAFSRASLMTRRIYSYASRAAGHYSGGPKGSSTSAYRRAHRPYSDIRMRIYDFEVLHQPAHKPLKYRREAPLQLLVKTSAKIVLRDKNKPKSFVHVIWLL